MAKQLNVNLSFTADTSQAAAQVRNLQQTLTQLINQPIGIGERLSADMVKATHAAAELKMHLQNATNVNTGTLDFGRLNQSLKASGVSLQQYATQLQSLGPQGQQAFMQLSRSVANAEVPLKRSSTLLQQFSTTLANTARWQLSSTLLHGFISAVSTAWNYSKELNESLNNIRIVTGYNIDQMSRFADQANRAAKALSTTTTEYTNASLIYYQQGLSDSEVLGRTETTIKMANASRQSAEVVSDQMTAIWNNFYDGSKSLEYYADVVTALGAATASSSEEIAQGLEKFAAVADTVGLSYEYATAALATVTATTRQSADVVGTAFKTLFARLSDLKLGETLEDGTTLGQYSENLAKIGVNIKDASGNLKDMDTILNETAAQWENLEKAQQVALAKGVAGIRQYTQFIALMDNWDFMEENLHTAEESGGTLEKQAKIYEESWEAASNRVKASLEDIYASIMDDEFFIKLTDGFATLMGGVGSFIKSIGGLKGVLSGLGWILTKVFAEQMTQGFQNLFYNIQMSTEAGRAAMQQLKLQQMQSFADSMVNFETSTVVDQTRAQIYKDEIMMQQQLIEKANELTTAEQNKYKVLIEQHRVMGEQTIEQAKQLEITKDRMAESSGILVGTGLNNNTRMQDAIGSVAFARENAESMATVEQILQKIGSTSKVTGAQIKQLQQEFDVLGLSRQDINELGNALKSASGNTTEMEVAITGVRGHLNSITGEIAKLVAELLGVDAGTKEFAALEQEVIKYIGHAKQAKMETDNLKTATDNGKLSVSQFGDSLAGAGVKAQSTAQLMSSAMSGLMSAGMLVSSFQGLMDAIKDPDISGWERFGRILTSVSMIGMSLMGTLTLIKTVIALTSRLTSQETGIKVANAIATWAQVKAEKSLNNTKNDSAGGTKRTIKQTLQDTKEKVKNAGRSVKNKASNIKNKAADTWNQGALRNNKNFTQTKSGAYAVKGTKGFVSADKAASMAGKQALTNLGKVATKFGAVAAAVAIVAVTITAAVNQYNKHNEAAKKAAEQAKEAASAHEKVQQAYSDFISKLDSYNDAKNGLKDLTKGTEEYEAAVIKANEASMELLKTYKDLAYTVDSDGLIVIDQESLDEAKKLQREQLANSQRSTLLAQQHAKDKQLEADAINLQRDKLKSHTASDYLQDGVNTAVGGVAGGIAGGLAAGALIGSSAGPIGAAIGAAIGLIGAGVATLVTKNANEEKQAAIDSLAKVYEKQGNAKFASDAAFEKLLREELKLDDKALIKSLVENREATANLAKEMAAQNKAKNSANASKIYEEYGDEIRKAGLKEEDAKAVSGVLGASLDEMIEEEYDKHYEDQMFGKTDADIQKAYAEKMGWDTETIENEKGNKAKYYDKNGQEVGVISDEVARRFLAEQAALSKLNNSVTEVSKKFASLANSTSDADQALKGFIETQDFSKLSQDQVAAIAEQIGTTNGEVTKADVEKYALSQFDIDGNGQIKKEEAQAYGFESYDDLVTQLLNSITDYEKTRDNVFSNLLEDTENAIAKNVSQTVQDNMTIAEMSTMGQHINKAALSGATEDDLAFLTKDIFNKAGEEAGELAVALNEINWTDITPDKLNKALKEAGITVNYTTDELNRLIDLMNTGAVESIDSIASKLKTFDEVSKIGQGDTISEEQYNTLSTTAQSYFTLMADGTYKLTQDALDFYQAVQADKKELIYTKTADYLKDYLEKRNVLDTDWGTLATGAETIESEYSNYTDYMDSTIGAYEEGGYGVTRDSSTGEVWLSKASYTGDGFGWMQGEQTEDGKETYQLYNAYGEKVESMGYDEKSGQVVYASIGEDGNTKYTNEYGDIVEGIDPTALLDQAAGYFETWGNEALWQADSDYQRQQKADSTLIKEEDQGTVQTQLDLLKNTEWGSENSDQLDEWNNALEQGTLTMLQAEAISARVRESGQTAYDSMAQTVDTTKEGLGQLYNEVFMNAESAEERLALLNDEELVPKGDEEAQQLALNAYSEAAMSAINQEKNEGLDVEEIDKYAKHLMKTAKASNLLSDELESNQEAAEEVAAYTMKMNKGIDKLADGFEDWSSVLKKSDKSSQEYCEAMEDMKDAMSDVLGVEEDFLTDDFILKNLEDIEKAATGDAEAIDRLAIAAGKEILIDLSMGDKNLQKELLGLQDTLLNKIPKDIKVGASLDTEDFGTAAQDLVDTAGMSVEEAQAYFNSLGYEPVFETELQDYTEQVPINESVDEVWDEPAPPFDHDGDPETPAVTPRKSHRKTKNWISGYDTVTYQKQVPILSADGTPKVKSLIKKPGGKMNNYSGSNGGGKSPGSGGGGGGGGGSKPQKAERKKKTEVVDRYKEITDALNKNSKAMDNASKAADGLYGASRIKNMDKINSLLRKEIGLLGEKRKEALRNLSIDRSELETQAKKAGVHFNFDENGNISNYTNEMTALYEELDAAITQANKDGNATEAEQEKIDAIQEKIDNVKDAISQYEETLEILAELDQEEIDKFNQTLANNFEKLNLELELQIEFDEMDLSYIEYLLSEIEDDVFKQVEAIGYTADQFQTYGSMFNSYEAHMKALEKAKAAGAISNASYVEGMKSINEAMLDQLSSLQSLKTTMEEYYGNTIALAQEEIAKYTDLMENAASVLDHYNSLMELTGKNKDYQMMNNLLRAQADVAEDAYRTSQSTYNMFKIQAEERKKAYEEGKNGPNADILKQQWLDAENAAAEAQDQMLSDAEAWGESLQAILDNTLSSLATDLENALTGDFGSFDALNSAMERKNSLQEEYLTTTNKIYETNKMMRNAQKEIDKTTNQMAKQRLKQFINETAAMQEQEQLSQYELEVQQAKYDLLLAEIALKEAQNAKSTVRLQRDSEGNFGYVYTANQDAIADAQQKFEDSQNALYNKGLEGANNYAQKYADIMSEMNDAMTEINQKWRDGEYETEEEYNKARQAAEEYYYSQLKNYSGLYQYALTVDSRVATDSWATSFGEMTTQTETWMKNIKDYMDKTKEAFNEYSSVMDKIAEETVGKDLDALKEKTSAVTKESERLRKMLIGENGNGGLVSELSTKLGEVLEEITKKYINQRKAIDDLIDSMKRMAEQAAANAENTAYDEFDVSPGSQVTVKSGVTGWVTDGDKGKENMGSVTGGRGYTVIRWDDGKKNVLVSDGAGNYGWIAVKDLVGFQGEDEDTASYDTGGYTGSWGSYGKLAMLHEKELVLNAADTENLLASMEFLNKILEIIDLQAISAQVGGILSSPSMTNNATSTIEQNVHIEASFPNATNHSEIEEAFNNLINISSQYANRK